MKFGWINLFGAAAVVLLLVPNIVYALKNRDEINKCRNKGMNLLEQIGRYACIVLMWLPLGVWEFGFRSTAAMLAYVLGCAVLLCAYEILFALHLHKKTARRAMALAILPACIFLLCGLTLRHWLLAAFAAVFAVGHIYVTKKNWT
ncbi:MAG: hypothetical protein IJT44_11785 [Clostridia bacterium]|nr:hypothetical protein [Clostridia bacterium]